MYFNSPGTKLVSKVWRLEEQMETFSSSGHVQKNATAKQVISRRWLDENVLEMYKNENARAKRAELMFISANVQNCDVLVNVVVVA